MLTCILLNDGRQEKNMEKGCTCYTRNPKMLKCSEKIYIIKLDEEA